MSFAGNLKTVSLPDIFQLIFASKKTGALFVRKNKSERRIYFKEGMLIYASSTDEEDLFGNLLLKRGKISKAELDKVLKTKQTGRKIGAALVERKLFTREEIIDCLKMQIEEIVYGLFGWKDGKFEFVEGKAPPAEVIQTELNPVNIIMEGTRRIDEWLELRKILPSDNTIVELVRDPARSGEMRLSKNEFIVLALVGSGKRVGKIIEESFLDRFLTSKALANLLQMGLVRPVKEELKDDSCEDEHKALVQLLAQIYMGNLMFVFDSLREKLGAKGDRLIFETFQQNKVYYPTLSQLLGGDNAQIDFDLFVKLYERLPAESRIWKIVSNFNALVNDYLDTVQKNLGNKIYRRVLSEIRINIQNYVNKNRQLSKKYGLEEEFSRALRDR